jgi:alpha-beta hydrolase superfamily lysophospholipase
VSSVTLLFVLSPAILALAVVGAFLVYVAIRYSPIIGRIFEEKPMFLPLRLTPEDQGEAVRFTTEDGLELAGSYFRARTERRSGVLVFCHEYLSDRWSFRPYTDHLRDQGFDLFTFDFRNHGASASDPTYHPLQWVTDHEVRDLRAALAYVRSRPDRDPADIGLFGVSRGGSTALVVAASEPGVWGVITDGAFPTRGTMLAYILRWAEIYVGNPYLWKGMPLWVFKFVSWTGRLRSEKRLNCRFPDVERAVARLAPRPWLMIHGAKDAYIGPKIAEALFSEAREPKELWIVPKAKHNRCREIDPKAYAARLGTFLEQYAPRRAPKPAQRPTPARPREHTPTAPATLATNLAATPLPG